ncbi:16S rRNA (cytosine(1402)-N(4))-methyltransferase RsmH [Neoehrlichia mikurensis]|uniref:Ribosomal RNA small subunit methyltransferase H n=1 Tax=Neoehrlichia mikurensis TaxID=89586 RepID=A0A9Q9BUN7_9RICK|nr:16S rRNA (cytosine(1402)-N(4))-methyltransferase RsmH [Neoehrlichia mikurensis]QXK91979.1 16S rRNA (cytosine(1402)-N(4))-methyltransferase RsmH [Neoehrlichia mikurensis]QXK92436.1 16S rRNA (cytosine(1402)-N(4))-methyltransferase RsmH [Neoehrlichia mikurensis]QXK93671.1 16S rRNA (cytosine(1402)-N(4))-methyltransferase RsmH [Neoehrlichia mikurensis]UTO55358.1 16S rRNA (cytosine(1402)-N(4))-methyltransferase RsmH [Neoehrlichia mikurensis]UTO56278.1 16S rRNA (cytosine(1402)-N(4))-methyltransfer
MHIPVLLKEVIDILSPQDDNIYIDATFGTGGYSREILQKSANCKVYAIDQDANAKIFYYQLAQDFPSRIAFYRDKFSNIKNIICDLNINKVDGVIFDLGLSSVQLDDGSRGFSFMRDGPLDMRMDVSSPINAATFVNTMREEDMANIIYQYGGERYARKVAKAIVNARKGKLIKNTKELASIISSVVPRSKVNSIDPATRTFQAIRILVNNELEELEKGLKCASEVLNTNGKIIVISFHSLEDRITKRIFKYLCNDTKKFKLLNKKIIQPTLEEINNNPRSRSAKLRSILKL